MWRLRAVGEFTVCRGDRPEPLTKVGSRKARTVLALLAVERGRLVTVDRIVAVVWQGSPPRLPAENVATLVSRLRAVLGPHAIVGGRAGYRLGPCCRVDLSDAAEMVTEAEARLRGGERTLAVVLAGRALDLLGEGPVLADQPDASWVEQARVRHADLLRRARHTAGQAALHTGDPRLARATAEATLATDPYDEVACRTLMRALVATGEPARGLAVYERLRARIADELGSDPDPATRDLHVAILRGCERAPHLAAAARSEDGFVDRDAELAQLADAWQAVSGGGVRLVLVTGEAGIGRSRLLDQVVRLAGTAGGAVVRGRCHELDRPVSLRPVLAALAQLVGGLPVAVLREAAGDRAGALATLLPELGNALGVTPVALGCDDADRHRCEDAVAAFLRRLSVQRPVLLALDDLQDADPATVRLMHGLARDPALAAGCRLLMLATVRVEQEEPVLASLGPLADRLELGPLDLPAITELAAAKGLADQADQVARRTGGHPLLVVEILHGLAIGEPGVPKRVRIATLERVRRAGPQAAELLRAAAVLGRRFTLAGLAPLLGIAEPAVALRCERIVRSRLIVLAGDGYEFTNKLVWEVLYQATPATTRAAYQRQAALAPARKRLRHRIRTAGRVLAARAP